MFPYMAFVPSSIIVRQQLPHMNDVIVLPSLSSLPFLCHHHYHPFPGSRTFIIGSSPHKHNQRPQGGWNYKADGGGLSGGDAPKVSAGKGDDCAEDGGGGGKDGE